MGSLTALAAAYLEASAALKPSYKSAPTCLTRSRSPCRAEATSPFALLLSYVKVHIMQNYVRTLTCLAWGRNMEKVFRRSDLDIPNAIAIRYIRKIALIRRISANVVQMH